MYREQKLGALIRVDSNKARDTLLGAYREAGTLDGAAAKLDVSKRSFCRWAKQLGISIEGERKKGPGRPRNGKLYTYLGQRKTLPEWAAWRGIRYSTLAARLKKMTFRKAIEQGPPALL